MAGPCHASRRARGGIERDALDGAARRIAALVVRVVVAPAGTPNHPDSLAQQKIKHLEACGEKPLAAGRRRRRTDVADDVVEVRQPVLVRIRYPLRPHQRVIRQPDHAAGHSGGTADEILLFDDQRLDSRIDRGKCGDHSTASAARDQKVDRFVPIHEAGTVSVSPRSATGTSMVVLVRWIAGTSRSYGKPARKPSMTRS
jgi:hypothetical protein